MRGILCGNTGVYNLRVIDSIHLNLIVVMSRSHVMSPKNASEWLFQNITGDTFFSQRIEGQALEIRCGSARDARIYLCQIILDRCISTV